MDTITATVIATLTGGVIGELQRRRLNSLAYRHPDEAELPAPGSRWWVSISLAATMGALVWRYPSIGDPWPLLFLLPVAVAAPWLAAVDLDVQRLPRTTTRATTLAAVIGIAITAATHQVADALVNGAFGYGVAYVLFWMIWRVLSRRARLRRRPPRRPHRPHHHAPHPLGHRTSPPSRQPWCRHLGHLQAFSTPHPLWPMAPRRLVPRGADPLSPNWGGGGRGRVAAEFLLAGGWCRPLAAGRVTPRECPQLESGTEGRSDGTSGVGSSLRAVVRPD